MKLNAQCQAALINIHFIYVRVSFDHMLIPNINATHRL